MSEIARVGYVTVDAPPAMSLDPALVITNPPSCDLFIQILLTPSLSSGSFDAALGLRAQRTADCSLDRRALTKA